MTDEDRILNLMKRQSRLKAEIERLQEEVPRDEERAEHIADLQQQHRDTVKELIGLLDGPLRAEMSGVRDKLDNAGLQYTEMVHEFFVKLMERAVAVDGNKMRTFVDLKRFVATVLLNQMRDHLKVEENRREIEEQFVAPMTEQKRKYFEERYRTSFLDFLDRIELWEESANADLHLAGRAMLLHYVAGEQWNVIASQLGITIDRLTELRKLAAREFLQK